MPSKDGKRLKYRQIIPVDKEGNEIPEENLTEELKTQLKKVNEEELTKEDEDILQELMEDGDISEIAIYGGKLSNVTKKDIVKFNQEHITKEMVAKIAAKIKKINDGK